jgi:hypothetical protein
MPSRDFLLKKKRNEPGDSIIISFDANWVEPMQQSEFSVVFRKHRPARMEPRWMYAYCSKPVSAIVARMPVISVLELPLDEAVKMCDRSMHTEDQIRKYAKSTFRDYMSLVVYEIGIVEYAKSPIPLRLLVADFDYWPSSTFIPLSVEGKRILDKLGSFGGRSESAAKPNAK